MLLKIAKSVETVIIKEKHLYYPKGPVKLIQRVEKAHSFLQSMSNLFHLQSVSNLFHQNLPI